MLKNIFKPTKKKIISSILLGIIISVIGFAIPQIYPNSGDSALIILGILNVGYFIFQFILAFILFFLLKMTPGFWTGIILLSLPFIGQFLYAYLIVSIYSRFKSRKQAKLENQNPPLTDQEIYPTIQPGMEQRADSLTKGVTMALPAKYAKKLRIVYTTVIAVLVLTLGSIWLYAQKSSKLPLVWTPKEAVEIVQPNTTKTVNVSFKANTNLNNVIFFITPALKGVVSVNPTSFTSISANQSYNVAIIINSGQTSQVKYEGTVQLKDSMNYATNAMPLPITVVVHNEPVPPDPGEAGKQTIEGIDSDNNGVRDDIQRWIVLNYLNSEKRRAALRQDAKIFQRFLSDADDKELSRVHDEGMERAGECEDYVFGVLSDAIRARRELEAQFTNTEARSQAYIQADSQLSGTFGLVIPEDRRKAQCQFDPDAMVN